MKRTWITVTATALVLACGAVIFLLYHDYHSAAIFRSEPVEFEKTVRGTPEEQLAIATNGANSFAFRLSGELAKTADESNLLCSPYSVWLPLASLVNATEEEQRTKLTESLGMPNITVENLNRASSRMLYDLTQRGEGVITLANALFVSNKYTLQKDTATALLNYFHCQGMKVDFSKKSSVDAVNKWANVNSGGKIPKIIDEFDSDTVAAIANAILFSDAWEDEFTASMTKEDIFHTPTGEVSVGMMYNGFDRQTYYEDERLQAVPLRFAGNASLYVLLPKEQTAAELLTELDGVYFDTIRNNMEQLPGTLLLPHFSLESSMDLTETLKVLNIPIFDAASLPLTGLIKENPLYLSQALQEVTFEVDEEGAEAAAVTVMSASAAAAEPPEENPQEPFLMECNKPFVFLLTSSTVDGGPLILFTGIVNNPIAD